MVGAQVSMTLDFDARPSVAAHMLRAVVPGCLRPAVPFPPLRARWRGMRPDAARLGQFLRLTGRGAARGLPVLYYSSEVELAATLAEGTSFALTVRGSDRPALLGRWAGSAAGGSQSGDALP